MTSVVVLLLIIILIVSRNLWRAPLPIWLSMAAGALVLLLFKSITVSAALAAINWNIIGFLAGVFVIAAAIQRSSLFVSVVDVLVSFRVSAAVVFFIFIVATALLTAVLMNDTVAIMATPLALECAQRYKMVATPWLLALAFAVTSGSLLSPIGSPQNLLIAVQAAVAHPFSLFFSYLWWPVLGSLGLIFSVIYWRYYHQFKNARCLENAVQAPVPVRLATGSFWLLFSVALLVLLLFLKFYLMEIHSQYFLSFYRVAIIAALPLLVFSKNRLAIIKGIDWQTLVFFMAMFIVVQAVWNTHYIQQVFSQMPFAMGSHSVIMVVSLLFSQFVSNVPAVALYLPWLQKMQLTQTELLALACGSTFAGNFLIIGAASNIIIIQKSERLIQERLSGWLFFKVGAVVSSLSLVLCYFALR